MAGDGSSAAYQQSSSAWKSRLRENSALKALGVSRLRLPSRNWSIFLSVVGSWTAAYYWDRRQQKREQQKWCTLVSHLAHDPLPINKLQRKLTVFLEAPPGDGLRSAREHFIDYVKPVLSAASIDYDVVEGRRQGDLRAGLAEKIRKKRRKAGEGSLDVYEQEKPDLELSMDRCRQRTGVEQWDGVGGDLVIGRHAWKEYIRGLHEGWLGPLDAPPQAEPQPSSPSETSSAIDIVRQKDEEGKGDADIPATPDADVLATPEADPLAAKGANEDDASPTVEKEESEKKPEPPPKPLVTPPYNAPASYQRSSLARSTPSELTPATAISFPHLLGFLRTPIRMWRFLNKRYDADAIGRQTAAAILASHRSFHQLQPSISSSAASPETTSASSADVTTDAHASQWEQEEVLKHEEFDWPKSVRKRPEDEAPRELEWLDPMVLDERIAARMRRFEVDQENEERAQRIAKGAKGIPGRINEPRSDYED